MTRRLLAFGTWCAALAGGLLLLHSAGGSSSPAAPETTAMAAVRVVGLALGWYLAVATAVGAGARLMGGLRLVRATDVVVVGSLRRLLDATVGASVALAATAPAAAWAAEPTITTVDEAPVVTIVRLPDDASAPRREADPLPATTSSSAPTAPPPTTTTTTTTSTGSPVEEQATPPPPAPAAPAEPAPPSGHPPAPTPPGPAPPTWTVVPGDHFWSIAHRVLADAWHRPPTDREVDPYWRRLVEVNRSVLADRGNPDLLFTGQVLTVPAPPRPP